MCRRESKPKRHSWQRVLTARAAYNKSGHQVAIRDMKQMQESQVYHWGIKKEAAMSNGPTGVPSVLSDDPSASVINVADSEPKSKSNEALHFVSPEYMQAMADNKTLWRGFYSNFISGTEALERIQRENYGVNLADDVQAVRDVGGVVDFIARDGLVDRNGNIIGKSWRELVEQIPNGQDNILQEYWEHLHNIDRLARGLPVLDATAVESRARADEIARSHPWVVAQKAEMQEAKQYGITYDEYIDAYQKVKRSFAEHPQMVGDRKGAIFSAIEGLPLSAEKKNVLYNFLKDVQPSDLTGKELNEYLKASGIKPELYEELAGEAARLKDIRDSTGVVITRRKEQLFGLIEAQKLTAKQKEVLWNLLG